MTDVLRTSARPTVTCANSDQDDEGCHKRRAAEWAQSSSGPNHQDAMLNVDCSGEPDHLDSTSSGGDDVGNITGVLIC